MSKVQRCRDGSKRGKVVELFAGVGGFRLGLEGHADNKKRPYQYAWPFYDPQWRTVWANQWEPPGTQRQRAFECYVHNFMPEAGRTETDAYDPQLGRVVNQDIHAVIDEIRNGEREKIPQHDLLVGGFPCQDYSVAKTRGRAHGLEGKKGVLWWEIHEILRDAPALVVGGKPPRFVLLENVDRLLRSPVDQRGRDFAVILHSLTQLGYLVEWRVVDASTYGYPQARKRVFIVASRGRRLGKEKAPSYLTTDGVLARALQTQETEGTLQGTEFEPFVIKGDLAEVSRPFGPNALHFYRAGVAVEGSSDGDSRVVTQGLTGQLEPRHEGPKHVLGDVLDPLTDEQLEDFEIAEDQIDAWKHQKGGKSIDRTAANGFKYSYSEGKMNFLDELEDPSRTILTGEGGTSPSRFKHVVEHRGVTRRLTPVELERLNGFPDDWTDMGSEVSAAQRAFLMGNALVVGIVHRIGRELHEELQTRAPRWQARSVPPIRTPS